MICVILCGGAGSRLWPMSRDMYPKPFFELPDGKSLLHHAVETAGRMPQVREIILVANAKLRANAIVELNAMQVAVPIRYMFEPIGRNTAAAITMAAQDVAVRHGADEPMLIQAADHLIADVDALAAAVTRAVEIGRDQKRLVTFGITPTRPETEYGYIRHQGEEVLQFVEKPSAAVAIHYLADGGYLWNSGMFCFTAGTILAEMRTHSPDVAAAVERCYSASAMAPERNEATLDEMTFRRVPSNSIDYAVMEKSTNIAVVECDIGWNDIGSWRSLCELYPKNFEGNRVIGECDTFFINTRDTTIHASQKVVAVIGMRDVLICDTDDALLVTTFEQSNQLRQVYEALKQRKHESSVMHRRVKPPWGEFTVLHKGEKYKLKRLCVLPGATLSLQSHSQRSERWMIVTGEGVVTRDDEQIPVKTGDSVSIPVGAKHRVECTSLDPMEIIEVQMGDYLGEDDIVRYQDAYGR
ncbi:MAG: mannose-1-phosphate guanylyltransferase/mannose-6-phosphate isomerase [Planctomycetaceae bacterium]|nr:mannose-1-phosphate guanylyltransferase/mannose-6-phosphate isomerase [Planctomycetaceae bacterium]